MASQEHIDRIKKDVPLWNEWAEAHPEVVADLSQADLRGTLLQKVNLKNAALKEARLQFCNLNGADLENANLKKAKLQEANLQSSNLKNARLNGAGLFEANLQYANLENADLTGAQFNEDTLFNQANLKGANLSQATGLSSSQIETAITDAKTQLPDYLDEEMGDDFLLQF
jgi:uncharacterized protein YjbI with pentapeptide repeats